MISYRPIINTLIMCQYIYMYIEKHGLNIIF